MERPGRRGSPQPTRANEPYHARTLGEGQILPEHARPPLKQVGQPLAQRFEARVSLIPG